jgi:ribonuclease HI
VPWIRRKLRDAVVYVRARADGQPDAGKDGRVDVMYQLRGGAKLYRASARNLAATGDPADDQPLPDPDAAAAAVTSQGGKSQSGKSQSGKPGTLPYHDGPIKLPAGAIAVWTDGACTGNPGPMGIGVVVIDGKERKELSEYLGVGTNNIAELTAIVRGLQVIPEARRGEPVYVHSDSGYALGLLGKGWKAKANQELVAELRQVATDFPQLHLVKVPGHAGVSENERCDELGRMAIMRGR